MICWNLTLVGILYCFSKTAVLCTQWLTPGSKYIRAKLDVSKLTSQLSNTERTKTRNEPLFDKHMRHVIPEAQRVYVLECGQVTQHCTRLFKLQPIKVSFDSWSSSPHCLFGAFAWSFYITSEAALVVFINGHVAESVIIFPVLLDLCASADNAFGGHWLQLTMPLTDWFRWFFLTCWWLKQFDGWGQCWRPSVSQRLKLSSPKQTW